MQPSTILLIIILISVVSYLADQILELINLRAQRDELPAEVASFYDAGKYQLAQAYHREQTRFGFITSAFSFGLGLLMLLFGGFGMLDAWLRTYFSNEIFLALAFFGSLALTMDI